MKQLILHIGTEKTGTTSLQNDLYRNRERLARWGVALLDSADAPNNRRIASLARLRPANELYDLQLASAGPDWREQLRSRIRQEISALPASVHTVLVTSEHLQSRLISAEEVAQVAGLFEGLFERTRIVVYLRRQDRLATSLYSTALRGGWTHASPFAEGVAVVRSLYYDYGALLGRWAAVFGRDSLVIRLFEPRSFEGGSLHADFLHACGLADAVHDWESGPVQNEAFSVPTVATLLAFNRAMERLGAGRESEPANALRWQLIHALEPRFPRPIFVPQRQLAREFLAHFQAGNAQVAQEWFGREALFDDDLNQYPEDPPELQLPWAAWELLLPLLVQAATAYLPAERGPQAEAQQQMMRALLAVTPQGPAPAVVRQVGQALQGKLPALGQRLQTISQQLPRPPAAASQSCTPRNSAT